MLKILEWTEEKLTTVELNNKLLLATDNKGMNVLQEATWMGRLDV